MSISAAIQSALSDTDGAAGVEFALVSPALILLLIGSVDLSSLAYQKAEVAAAADAGAMYAMNHCGRSCSTASVGTAAQSATPLGANVTATVTPEYACSNVSQSSLSTTAPSSCSSNAAVASYILVQTQANYAPLISWGRLTFPATLSGQSLVRIQ
jgi:Flp pilus assembly protein TadG